MSYYSNHCIDTLCNHCRDNLCQHACHNSEPITNPLKQGDKVKYKDGDNGIFTVYAVYSADTVSLGLRDYPDIEQDFTVSIHALEKIP